jgi:hypothetical protein
VKIVLSALLGVILLTSLVGFSYAATPVQPLQNNSYYCQQPSNQNNPDCPHDGTHGQGDPGTPHSSNCAVGGASPKAPDPSCCEFSAHGLEGTCCLDGVTPHSVESSDIQPDTNCFG